MALVFTSPGKLGDALLQWPVAYHYCKQQKTTCTLWLDEKTCAPLVPLFKAQPCVDDVVLKPGIENHRMGGQPWDFGLTTKDFLDNEIYHLGMRTFPTRQITLETLEHVPLQIDRAAIATEPSISTVISHLPANRLVLHGTFVAQGSAGTPGFWRFLARVKDELSHIFEEIVFVGTPNERERALELYPEWKDFDDHGSFLELAELMSGSRCVIGAGSSVVVLSGAMKVPTIRVHDPIGQCPKVIWTNLGPGQVNDTELELRSTWPSFRDEFLPSKIIV